MKSLLRHQLSISMKSSQSQTYRLVIYIYRSRLSQENWINPTYILNLIPKKEIVKNFMCVVCLSLIEQNVHYFENIEIVIYIITVH